MRLHFHKIRLAQTESLRPGGGEPEPVHNELHAAGQLVEDTGIGGCIGDGLRGIDKGVVQLSGLFCQFIDVPREFLPLGGLLLGIGEGAVGKQEGGNLLPHVAQLLPQRLSGVLRFEFELPLLVRKLDKTGFLGIEFRPERGKF